MGVLRYRKVGELLILKQVLFGFLYLIQVIFGLSL